MFLDLYLLQDYAEVKDHRLPSLRATSQTFSSQSFTIERDGEMPEGARLLAPQSQTQTPAQSDIYSPTPSILSSIPPYEVPDDDTRTSTPEPIKVTRAKKKVATKKKRTQNPPETVALPS